MGDAAQDAYEADGGFDDLYPKPRKVTTCPKCGRKMRRSIGLADHMRDAHGITPKETE